MTDDINDNKNNDKLKPVNEQKASDKSKKDTKEEDFPEVENGFEEEADFDENQSDKSDKMAIGVKEEILVKHFVYGTTHSAMPDLTPTRPLPVKIFDPGAGSFVRIVKYDYRKKLVTELDYKSLVKTIGRYIGDHFSNPMQRQTFALSTSQIKNLGERFLWRAEEIEEWPKPLGFKTSKGYFFERHDFDPIECSSLEKFPTIAGFLKRTENAKSLCQIIGSILEGKPIRKLSPLLWGDKGTGKSTFFRILRRLFGKLACKTVPDTFGKDKFASKFVENTAAWFADDIEDKMINCNDFKKLTGSDIYPVRAIGKDYVDVKIDGIFFMSANPEKILGIQNQKAIVEERILSCMVKPFLESLKIHDEEEVIAKAVAEFEYFAGFCIRIFKKLGHKIKYHRTSLLIKRVIAEAEVDLDAIFNRYLEIDPSHTKKKTSIDSVAWQQLWEYICTNNYQFAKEVKKKDFNSFVARKLGRGSHIVKYRVGNGTAYGVSGIKIKEKLINKELNPF